MGRASGLPIGLQKALPEILSPQAPQELRGWLRWARRSRLASFRDCPKQSMSTRGGIIALLRSPITNGIHEAIRAPSQLAKRMTRGFSELPFPENCRVPQSRKVAARSSRSTHLKQRRGMIYKVTSGTDPRLRSVTHSDGEALPQRRQGRLDLSKMASVE
ncbi:transposase [Methylacidimicrobium sp. B4]|uniref:transposase n=1 Tax=Methylacidimicrobium sp. B4 TaxID=2796139 RepID=UPI001F5D1359|nr:transposase [Methylacidimicrobium sp. B4]